jgi:perosamine synthetase
MDRSTAFLPYGRQWLDEADIDAVVNVLRSDWLTTGPKIAEFEQAFAQVTGAKESVALHAAMFALDIGPGDEVIVPPMTFAASANCVVYQGGTPVFADVQPDTLLIDPEQVLAQITPRTKAIVAVDYAGQPCDYDELQIIADQYGLPIVADACHALGGAYKNRPVGTLATLSAFSLHPVKHITTGEGGVITTDDSELARRMRTFRNHGITTDHRQREEQGSWFYEMVDLGYNYRLTDFQCALGISQLQKLPGWIERRQAIARCYNEAFEAFPEIKPLLVQAHVSHAYHLYVVQVDNHVVSRSALFAALRRAGIGVNVHYVPVHLHPFYRKRFGTEPGLCPVAEAAYEQILSLPIWPGMDDQDVANVIETLTTVIKPYLG